MRKLLLPAALAALCACATAKLDEIQVGPWFAPRDWREVEVFSSREETRRPWGGIGIIHGPRVSSASGQREMERMKTQARRQAAAMGADAVIIAVDQADSGPAMGQYVEPEMYLSALAIKYVVNVSTADIVRD